MGFPSFAVGSALQRIFAHNDCVATGARARPGPTEKVR
jgi:hypothetical protein